MISRHIIWIAILLMSVSTASTASPPADIDGATVYANNCNRCHEYRSPTEFNGPQWSIITTHMRVIGGIPADESRAVFEYLKAQHHPPYVALTVPSLAPAVVGPAQGRTLVQQRGCIGCHVVEGQGGTMGPPLDGVSDRRSEAFVIRQLRNPQANNPASLMPNLGLDPAEIETIWVYLQTLDGTDGS